MVDRDRLQAAYHKVRDALLAERHPQGYWEGELSTSALSTAVAVIALHLVDSQKHHVLITSGIRWLAEHQNPDGGWGDTTRNFSNISTSMLVRAAFRITDSEAQHAATVELLEQYLNQHCGTSMAGRAEAIRQRYGKDRTFSVPILMTCALAGLVSWPEVPRLPYELAALPQSWYRFARLPVVSYALPALIAIGQCIHHHRPTYNPITAPLRKITRERTLRVLQAIQPSSGGYLEATPLTSFVCMSLASVGLAEHTVVRSGVDFIVQSVRPDGSWPIDTNLSIWVTTLSVNALAAADDLDALEHKPALLDWLLANQMRERHPYTGAAPGGWGWSHCPGSVPDCDDTPGAILAVHTLSDAIEVRQAADRGREWMLSLQNGDGGFPTFCRGWGTLPFDRSGADLTAHALRALAPIIREHTQKPPSFWTLDPDAPWPVQAAELALKYLQKQQFPDGSWLPLWFGNQHAPDDINPVYGTARVLAAYRDLDAMDLPEAQRGVEYLLAVQNPDGGWGGAKGCPSSIEETALAIEVLLDVPQAHEAVQRGLEWLIPQVEAERYREASPIGFYFAKLWYFEKLYPIIFCVAALGRAVRNQRQSLA